MSEHLERLATGLRGAFPDLRFEITAFASGAAMLDLWLGERFVVVQATPDGEYIVDDNPDARPFNAGHAFATRDPDALKSWLVATLGAD